MYLIVLLDRILRALRGVLTLAGREETVDLGVAGGRGEGTWSLWLL